jgi:hypothetical protein
MTGSLWTHGNDAISIWSKRVTLSPLVQSAMRPGFDRVLSNPVNTQVPSSETTNWSSLARTARVRQVCGAMSASTPTFFGHPIGYEQEQNPVSQRIQFDEIVVVGCSQAQGEAAVTIRRASGRLKAEADLDIFQRRCFGDCERKSVLGSFYARLLDRVGNKCVGTGKVGLAPHIDDDWRSIGTQPRIQFIG